MIFLIVMIFDNHVNQENHDNLRSILPKS